MTDPPERGGLLRWIQGRFMALALRAEADLEASKAYPERLGTGRPFDPDFRLQDCLAAVCRAERGDRAGAEEAMRAVREATVKNGAGWGRYHYFGLAALEAAGEREKARSLLEELERRRPGDPAVAWCRAKLSGDGRKAGEIAARLSSDPRFAVMVEAARFVLPGR